MGLVEPSGGQSAGDIQAICDGRRRERVTPPVLPSAALARSVVCHHALDIDLAPARKRLNSGSNISRLRTALQRCVATSLRLVSWYRIRTMTGPRVIARTVANSLCDARRGRSSRWQDLVSTSFGGP